MSRTGTGRRSPRGWRKSGRSLTAARSDAQDARIARFTSGSKVGCLTTSKGLRKWSRDMDFASFLPVTLSSWRESPLKILENG